MPRTIRLDPDAQLALTGTTAGCPCDVQVGDALIAFLEAIDEQERGVTAVILDLCHIRHLGRAQQRAADRTRR